MTGINLQGSGSIHRLLNRIVEASQNTTEKGMHFEKLVKIYLERDNLQSQQFDQIWHYTDWAQMMEFDITEDMGIDLVARMADNSGYAAIQCKFYAENRNILRSDIQKFVNDAVAKKFKHLMLAVAGAGHVGKKVHDLLKRSDEYYRVIDSDAMENSNIDWDAFGRGQKNDKKQKKLRPHQKRAVAAVCSGLNDADRGKLIMACGTGKTFTSLRIAEKIASNGLVLFVVPSLALMSQVVREWKNDSRIGVKAFAVCSDEKVGRERSKNNDDIDLTPHNLPFPATTNPGKISDIVKLSKTDEGMTVVFSTYHSIMVIEEAQMKNKMPEFDLIICDEAHRTAGSALKSEKATDDESHFTRIHNCKLISGKKRLYMTATPKIYSNRAKDDADRAEVELYSMDDPSKFGEVLFHYGFSKAVDDGVLTDYKVIVLEMSADIVSNSIQEYTKESKEIDIDDATKIVGCYKALAKKNLHKEGKAPMRRALAFCDSIIRSKQVADVFGHIVEEFNKFDSDSSSLGIESRHVDGTFNSEARAEVVHWLRRDPVGNQCKVLSNVRCLNEGVDVPELDAILFLHPRKRQVDVVQAVGRVMRRYPGKKMGYVILPVVIPAGVEAEAALNHNDRYQVVWQVLNALRSHDERLNAKINAISIGQDVDDKIKIVSYREIEKVEDIESAVVYDKFNIKRKNKPDGPNIGRGTTTPGQKKRHITPEQLSMYGAFHSDEFTKAIQAKIVKRCGKRAYWQDLASGLGDITIKFIDEITSIVSNEGSIEEMVFLEFFDELKKNLNPTISKEDAIDMLGQHMAVKPVFSSMFSDHKFTESNPVSKSMDRVLRKLDKNEFKEIRMSLGEFYTNIEWCIRAITNHQGKQNLLKEIYQRLFNEAFPKLSGQLGIVYTPIEVVDFIIHSVDDALRKHFNQTLGSKGVHILDPFTGTGTFITRLLHSGLISNSEISHKYRREIHANEILPLAYYVAAINIEEAYHNLRGGGYAPFHGIALVDTFQLFEEEGGVELKLFDENAERRHSQKNLDIRVIFGNPPYSTGQRNVNDSAENVGYPKLQARISQTYGGQKNPREVHNSYIKAIRWATDRIMEGDCGKGVVAFVTPATWIEYAFASQMRKSLTEDYSDLYIFHLRGDINSARKGKKGEGGNIFGSGSQSPIAISVLVRDPKSETFGKIRYFDVMNGRDEMTALEKLNAIDGYKSISGISKRESWEILTSDINNNWLDHVDEVYAKYPLLGSKSKKDNPIFENYTNGPKTHRDMWVYNGSVDSLQKNMTITISTYNTDLEQGLPLVSACHDDNKISWSRGLKEDYSRGNRAVPYTEKYLRTAMFRPFHKTNFYFDPMFVQEKYSIGKVFPNEDSVNRVINLTSKNSRVGVSALMMDTLPDHNSMHVGNLFPLYIYENIDGEIRKLDAVSDTALLRFRIAYPGENISKEDIFYYAYGLLHALDYRRNYSNDLKKEFPRIAPVKSFSDFKQIRDSGRLLGDMHVGYESADPYNVTFSKGDPDDSISNVDSVFRYRVEKMKFHGGKAKGDWSTVHYNDHITMMDIPLRAYDYQLGGRSALEWVMSQWGRRLDPKSGIVNDTYEYALNNLGNPRYPLDLFCRIITISLKTLDIMDNLPPIDLMDPSGGWNSPQLDIGSLGLFSPR